MKNYTVKCVGARLINYQHIQPGRFQVDFQNEQFQKPLNIERRDEDIKVELFSSYLAEVGQNFVLTIETEEEYKRRISGVAGALTSAITEVTPLEPISCEDCGETFENKTELDLHNEVNQGFCGAKK